MNLTLFSKKKIDSMTLPEKIAGQYYLNNMICIEGVKEKNIESSKESSIWLLKSNSLATILDDGGNIVSCIPLSLHSAYTLRIRATDESCVLITEPMTTDRQRFDKYTVAGHKPTKISFGRDVRNDIAFSNQYVGAFHANFILDSGILSIEDLNSKNGTYVNGLRLNKRQVLLPGDLIYLLGFKIVIGKDFIAINNPDSKIALNAGVFTPWRRQTLEKPDTPEEEIEICKTPYFYRSPRFKREGEKAVIKADSPPDNAIGEETPFMFVLGPSMTMGMASMATGIFAVTNAMATGNIKSALPSVVMSSSMLLGTVMWPIISKRYDKKKRRKKEALRQVKYTDYLRQIEQQIKDSCVKQEEILRENFVGIEECENRIQGLQKNLWERGIAHSDFLELRLGLGEKPLEAEITYDERKFTLVEDNLRESMFALMESPKLLRDVPITLSFLEHAITGVYSSSRELLLRFAAGLIFQIAAFYSYDDVKIILMMDEEDIGFFSPIRWLPHIWADDRQFRFFAANAGEAKEISALLENEITARIHMKQGEIRDAAPYYIIFSLSRALSLRTELLKRIFSHKGNLNISVISFMSALTDLPKECTAAVELENDNGKIFRIPDTSGQYISFKPDMFLKAQPIKLSVTLANNALDIIGASYKLPSLITFLEMFSISKIEHLNVLTRWKENDPTVSLEAPIGVTTLGDPFKLDLHEKFHGPHGLVAGMTGSGKSEFIITYILSMAVNYHPYEVSFVLIDYKGGGMAKAFERLPHTAGIITNLDGAAVNRSLVSIESELKRRQALFKTASEKIGESKIDIYKYQKLFRDGLINEPLSHLFIIADEFAELKDQQREFMASLISAARIGRELGVHLILATQKPSGVVDDQIWSNSHFHLCLKVQEKSDSMDMLKRPEAAELSDKGRFYLQVGYNELFELGQSAWAGALYLPEVQNSFDRSVTVINRIGRIIKHVKYDPLSFHARPQKQLDAITNYIELIASEEDISAVRLWLPPIPGLIYKDAIIRKYHSEYVFLNPVVGEYDDPVHQRQDVFRLPIYEGNITLYGAAGSGKTTFLTTMICSLLADHSPDKLNLYIMDFASETLKLFANAPHVGDVVVAGDTEKLSNLFKLLYQEIKSRQKKFSDFGGDYFSYLTGTGEKLPAIITVIHNYAVFRENFPDKEDALNYITREGIRYGMYFILTATASNAIRLQTLSNFKQTFVLQMNDLSDYTALIGRTHGLYPSKYKGRGLMKTDSVYEFQTARFTDDDTPFDAIRAFCAKLSTEWRGTAAKRIPLLPEKVDTAFVSRAIQDPKSLKLPIGVEINSLGVHFYDFGASLATMILSVGSEYEDFLTALGKMTEIESLRSEGQVETLYDLAIYRNNNYKEMLEKHEALPVYPQKVFALSSYSTFKSSLTEQGRIKLSLVLEKAEPYYGLHFLIGDSEKKVSSYVSEKWYHKHISQSDGIWIGRGFSQQYRLIPDKQTHETQEETNALFGFSLVQGKAVKIKILRWRDWEDD
jgi:S-DNA-T family DNA segregation ATPase FtsK/SpoIIIE